MRPDDNDCLAPFDEWAPPDPSVDFPLWYKLAYSADEPILVVGPGSARIAVPLAEYGIRSVGLESSTEAVERGRRRTEYGPDRPVTFRSGDVQSVDLRQKFGLAIFPANTFLRLLTPEGQRAALTNVRRHLRLGGRLALAIAVPSLTALAAAVDHQAGVVRFLGEQVGEGGDGRTVVYEHRRVFPLEQIIEQHLVAETLDPDGRTVGRYHRQTRVAYLWPREMGHLLALAGFEVEALTGGFRDEPFGPQSVQQVWVARKMSE